MLCINTETLNELFVSQIYDWWREDASKNELLSQQIWKKRKNFLNNCKNRDLEAGNFILKRKEVQFKPISGHYTKLHHNSQLSVDKCDTNILLDLSTLSETSSLLDDLSD